jgi:hypothetical protein
MKKSRARSLKRSAEVVAERFSLPRAGNVSNETFRVDCVIPLSEEGGKATDSHLFGMQNFASIKIGVEHSNFKWAFPRGECACDSSVSPILPFEAGIGKDLPFRALVTEDIKDK